MSRFPVSIDRKANWTLICDHRSRLHLHLSVMTQHMRCQSLERLEPSLTLFVKTAPPLWNSFLRQFRWVTHRSESDVKCVGATSQNASFKPWCWWEMCDFVRCAFRFCWCVGSLQCLWYGWVNCTFQVTSSSVQQCSFVQVSAFNRFSLSLKCTAPLLYFCASHWCS